MNFLNLFYSSYLISAFTFVRSAPVETLNSIENSAEHQYDFPYNSSGAVHEENNLFPDTYSDDSGKIQPRIFIAEDFLGKEVFTTGSIEFDDNESPFSTMTVIVTETESEDVRNNWFSDLVKKLGSWYF